MSVIMVKLELLIEDDIEEKDLLEECSLEDYTRELIEEYGIDDCLIDGEYKILECDFVKNK